MKRAKTLLGGKAPVRAAVGFSVRCFCGENIVGQRRDDHQSIICPSCGQAVFVLARSPLPDLALPPPAVAAPPAPAGRRAVGKRVDRGELVAEAKPVIGEATVAMEVDELMLELPKERRRSSAAARPPQPERPAIERSRRLPSLGAMARRLVPPRRWFTVPRLVFMGVAFLVTATVYWQVHARQLRQLREELVPAGRRGLQALAEGKFDEARERLAFAVRALDAVGDDFPDAARFRQAHGELELVANLLATPLEDLVGDDDAIAKRLAGTHLVIDAEIEKANGGWRVGVLGFIHGKPVEVEPGPMRLFDRIGVDSKTRLVFGAAIQRVWLADGQKWLVRLAPDSGVLLTDARVFQELGLLRDPAAMQLRDRQKILIEKTMSATP